MKRAFLSPQINPLVVQIVRIMMPVILHEMLGGLSVRISDEDLRKLRKYQGERMLILPNHPTGEEPYVLFDVSKRLGEVFNYVAAREVFDWEHGFRGWVLRRIGTYSVIRGTADRESFMTSKRILMEGKNRLVIFIEGEISRENETLIPFEPGVVQLAFWAEEGLAKQAEKASGDFEPIYLAPVAIRYFYNSGTEKVIERALSELEQAVGVEQSADNPVQRLRDIGDKVLSVQEAQLNLVVTPGLTLTDRVMAVRSRILRKIELFLDLRPGPDETTLGRIREIRNMMDRMIHQYEDEAPRTHYEARSLEHLRSTLNEFYEDLDRVVYFLTYDENYLRNDPTPERIIEVIRRLEKEVYGKSRLVHPRTAVVKVGDVLNIKSRFSDYTVDKKVVVKAIAQEMETDVARMLASMQRPTS